MANDRYVRFDANRAFYLATVAIALMGGSFAVGLRLGQDMPASLENMFSGPISNDVADPILAPEQVVPVETYTFYDSQRALDREPRDEPAEPTPVAVEVEPAHDPEPSATRVLDREPVVVAEPAAEVEPSLEEQPEPVAEGDSEEAEAPVQPARIERETVVRSMDDVDGF